MWLVDVLERHSKALADPYSNPPTADNRGSITLTLSVISSAMFSLSAGKDEPFCMTNIRVYRTKTQSPMWR